MKNKVKTPLKSILPEMPWWLDRSLGKFEWFRKLRRRNKQSPDTYPTLSWIKDYPLWIKDSHYNGFDGYFTKYHDRYFQVVLSFRDAYEQPFCTQFAEWKTFHNYGDTTTRWDYIETKYFSSVKEAELYREEIMKEFEMKIMEDIL